MVDQSVKIREKAARRALKRRGYTLEKSRRRDPAAWDYGTYRITDAMAPVLTTPWTATLPSLEDVEHLLSGGAVSQEIPSRLSGTLHRP